MNETLGEGWRAGFVEQMRGLDRRLDDLGRDIKGNRESASTANDKLAVKLDGIRDTMASQTEMVDHEKRIRGLEDFRTRFVAISLFLQALWIAVWVVID